MQLRQIAKHNCYQDYHGYQSINTAVRRLNMARHTKTLSMFSYFGGKSKLAPIICDLLDYENTSIYIEPFGGACRTLLNKPKGNHVREIYNDSSAGLCTFVRVMSSPDTAQTLIERLYQTEYSQAEFDRALALRNMVDDSVEKYYADEIAKLYRSLKKKEDWDKKFVPTEEEVDHAKSLLTRWDEIKSAHDNDFDAKVSASSSIQDQVDPIELAAATYVVYAQSRDGMGKHWTSYKYKNQEAYYKKIDQLYEVAERLEGVEVYQVNAQIMLSMGEYIKNHKNHKGLNSIVKDDWVDFLNDPTVCCYADPSYLDPDETEKPPKDLGEGTYKFGTSYEDHERLLKMFYDCKCRMVVSNYDSELYNRYLSEENGWKKLEIPTKTSVGGKKGNNRVEVLWFNY